MSDSNRPNSKKRYGFVGLILASAVLFAALHFIPPMLNQRRLEKVVGLGLNTNQQLGSLDQSYQSATLQPLKLTGQLDGQTVVSAKAGSYHTLLLTSSGQVFGMGSNKFNEISPSGVQSFDKPQRITFDGLKTDEKIVQIDTSRFHNLALTNFGRVYAWGENYNGQLGDGTNTRRGQPEVVANVPKATQISAGYRHSVVITDKGEVYAWGGSCSASTLSRAQSLIAQAGSNISALGGYGSQTQSDLQPEDVSDCSTEGSTFVQSKTPRRLNGFEGKATQISAGYGHLLIMNEAGDVYSAGCNSFHQLGRDKSTGPNKNDLAKVELPGPAATISAGFRHSVVQLRDGTIWLWGYNGAGVALLVDDHSEFVEKPLKLLVPGKLTDLEAGHDTTFAARGGNLIGWGQDDATAFWDSGTPDHVQTLGKINGNGIKLSAGIEHLVGVVQ